MSFERRWLLKDHVCYIQFTDTVTLDDIKELSSEHEALILANGQGNRIHYIIDTEQVKNYPRDIRSIKRHLTGRIRGVGWMLMISNDFFIVHLGNIFGQLFRFKVKSVVSINHAYRFLQSVDEVSLPQYSFDDIQDIVPVA